MAVCDRCRLEGSMDRCGTCDAYYKEGGEDGGGGSSGGSGGFQGGGYVPGSQVMCGNHPSAPAEVMCPNCGEQRCMTCMATGDMCVSCRSVEEGFGTGYGDDGGGITNPQKRSGPKKGPPAGGKKGAPAAKGKKGAKGKKKGGLPVGPIAAGVLVLALLGGGGYYAMTMRGGGTEAGDPGTSGGKVAVVAPKAGSLLKGMQKIKLSVGPAGNIDFVEVTVDNKHWEKLREPPWETEWQSALVTNGEHTIGMQVLYKDGSPTAKSTIKVKVKNRGL